jgi:hypothetical protein
MKKLWSKISNIHLGFWLYFFIFLLLFIGLGEALCRKSAQDYNPLSDSGFTPAISQFTNIKKYVQKNGAPECFLFGNSLVQVGIDPITFSKAFYESSGKQIDCYNFGMNGSTLSSTAPIAEIIAGMYKPSYLIIGVQVFSFIPHQVANTTDNLVEDRFQNYSWVRYKLGHFNLAGWMIDKSALYKSLKKNVLWMFPAQSTATATVSTRKHPEVPRIINQAGYGGLPGYRDLSPVFYTTKSQNDNGDYILDPQDLAAAEELIKFAQKTNLHLIFVEMPINDPPEYSKGANHQIETTIRQNGVAYLSTDGLPPLPATAYSDQNHLQISGGLMFSQWLGMQLGNAEAEGVLSDVNSPLWSPVLEAWPKPTFLATLGLSEIRYNKYLLSMSKFNLLPRDAVIFNPSEKKNDNQFLQSLIGFVIDWKAYVTDQDRDNLYQFMTLLGRMRYQDDLQLSGVQATRLKKWRTTLDSSVLIDLGIQYVICPVELADPKIKNCPSGIASNPNYVLVKKWKLDPLYEEYSLYNIVGSN